MFQSFDVELHILASDVCQTVTWLLARGPDRRCNRAGNGLNMPGKVVMSFGGGNRGIDSAAMLMSQYHDQWHAKYQYGKLETGQNVGSHVIAGNPRDKQVTALFIKTQFGCHPGISAADNTGIGVLPARQGLSITIECERGRRSCHIALVARHQSRQRSIGRERIVRLGQHVVVGCDRVSEGQSYQAQAQPRPRQALEKIAFAGARRAAALLNCWIVTVWFAHPLLAHTCAPTRDQRGKSLH